LVLVENGVYNPYDIMASVGASSKDPLDGTKVTGSLENVHNNYHSQIGGDPHRARAGHRLLFPQQLLTQSSGSIIGNIFL
jgi:hypothetical protein